MHRAIERAVESTERSDIWVVLPGELVRPEPSESSPFVVAVGLGHRGTS